VALTSSAASADTEFMNSVRTEPSGTEVFAMPGPYEFMISWHFMLHFKPTPHQQNYTSLGLCLILFGLSERLSMSELWATRWPKMWVRGEMLQTTRQHVFRASTHKAQRDFMSALAYWTVWIVHDLDDATQKLNYVVVNRGWPNGNSPILMVYTCLYHLFWKKLCI
jgi:hypothetical protein